MKKTVVAIFAHPDDEAFGPAGTLALLAQDHDVYLLCATRGEAGQNNSPEKKHIGDIREQELRKSAAILGIKEVYFLGFDDGMLANNLYHRLADAIQSHLERIKPATLITFEPRGVSGHLDHIAVSMVTTFIFHKISYVKTLMYYCISEERRAKVRDYYIYFPPGYKSSEIDKTYDISSTWDTKVAAMRAHASQKNDVETIYDEIKDLPKKEHFIVLTK